MTDYYIQDIIRIIVAPLLALFAVPRQRYFAWVLASEMVVSSVFAQSLLIADAPDGIYYDIILLFHALFFFHLLLYKAQFSTYWPKRTIDTYTGWGCMLILANAVFQMGILGEHILNEMHQTTKTTFVGGYSNIMIWLQVIQFGLLIRVIDVGRILRSASNACAGFFGRRFRDSLVCDRIAHWIRRA